MLFVLHLLLKTTDISIYNTFSASVPLGLLKNQNAQLLHHMKRFLQTLDGSTLHLFTDYVLLLMKL